MPVRSELEREGAIRVWLEGKVERAIARDPYGAGPPLTESGKTRRLVFEGARSIGMPSV